MSVQAIRVWTVVRVRMLWMATRAHAWTDMEARTAKTVSTGTCNTQMSIVIGIYWDYVRLLTALILVQVRARRLPGATLLHKPNGE